MDVSCLLPEHLQLINAVPLELLLEHCGFRGFFLVLSLKWMLCIALGLRKAHLGRVWFGGSSAFTPLWPLVMPEITEPSASCARAVGGGFYSGCCL